MWEMLKKVMSVREFLYFSDFSKHTSHVFHFQSNMIFSKPTHFVSSRRNEILFLLSLLANKKVYQVLYRNQSIPSHPDLVACNTINLIKFRKNMINIYISSR